MSKFSLVRNSIVVTLVDTDQKEVECELREMTASDRDEYLTELRKRVQVGKDGEATGVRDFKGLQADLVHACLFRSGERVPKDEIQGWPASAVTSIYQAAQQLNKLDRTEGEPLPNA